MAVLTFLVERNRPRLRTTCSKHRLFANTHWKLWTEQSNKASRASGRTERCACRHPVRGTYLAAEFGNHSRLLYFSLSLSLSISHSLSLSLTHTLTSLPTQSAVIQVYERRSVSVLTLGIAESISQMPLHFCQTIRCHIPYDNPENNKTLQ